MCASLTTSFAGKAGAHGLERTGTNELAPGLDLVPAAELKPRRRIIRVEQHHLGHPPQLIDRCERLAHSLLDRAREPRVRLPRAVKARLVADGTCKKLKRPDVALAREQHASAAVVPDRSGLLGAVARLDLSQVVVAEQELDALAWTAGCVAGKPWDASEVRRLIQCDQQSGRKHTALRACPGGGSPEQRHEQRREERPAALGVLGRCDPIARARLRAQPVEI